MKTKKPTETIYTLNRGVLTEQLFRDDSFNWILELGAKQFEEGVVPSKHMAAFMEHIGVLSIKNK